MKGRRCSSCSTRFDCSLIGTEVINEQPASKMVFRPVRVGHTQRQPGPNPATGTDPCLSHEPQPDGGKGRSSRHRRRRAHRRSEEHTSELQSLMRYSYAVFCLKKKKPH